VLYVVESHSEEVMKQLMEVKETLETIQIKVAQQKEAEQHESLV
jgi:hypothetical protein